MSRYQEDYWKLADVEGRFNQLQGSLRLLASTWTLAAFAGLAVLARSSGGPDWLAPPLLLAWLVANLSSSGLVLLWILDQFVYQRLLGAAFLSALLLERRHLDLPALRSLMLLGSSKAKGMARYIKIFYFVPIAFFFVAGLVFVVLDIYGVLFVNQPISDSLRCGLLVGSVIMAAVLSRVFWLSRSVGVTALARGVDIPELARAVGGEELKKRVQLDLTAKQ